MFIYQNLKLKHRRDFLIFFLIFVLVGIMIGLEPLISLIFLSGAILAGLIFLFPKYFLYFLVFCLPFLPALNLAPGFDIAGSRVLIILIFAAWFIRGLLKKDLKISFDFISIFLIGFLLFVSLTILYTPIFERTGRKLLVFYSIFPLYFIYFDYLKKYGGKFLIKTLKILGLSGFLVSFFGFFQFMLQFIAGKELIIKIYSNYLGGFLWGETAAKSVYENPSWLFDAGFADLLRAFSTLPDPHIFSFFLSFTAPAQGYLIYHYWRKNKKKGNETFPLLFWAGAFLLSLINEFLTFSRGGYVGFFLAVSCLVFLLIIKKIKKNPVSFLRKKHNRQNFFYGFTIFVGLALLFGLGYYFFPQNPLSKRITSIFNIQEGSNLGRLKIWSQAYNLFKDNFYFGVGLGAYSYEIKPSKHYRDPIYAHNIYLEFLAETGIIGFLLYFGVILYAILYPLKSFLFKNSSVSLALLTGLIWFLIHGFFEMPLYSPVILPLFMINLAMVSYENSAAGKL
ncbi:MAG: hypothetical protein GF335_00765 [Candidatus Moranbacteria bacterium]|nr:hypothetical protein [Candidatus Moranbacteria bacterium]